MYAMLTIIVTAQLLWFLFLPAVVNDDKFSVQQESFTVLMMVRLATWLSFCWYTFSQRQWNCETVV